MIIHTLKILIEYEDADVISNLNLVSSHLYSNKKNNE